jgi:hypothetical protein
MASDPYPYFEFLTQGQIGNVCGVSAHQVGRWLRALGLRGGKVPSPQALRSGLAEAVVDGAASSDSGGPENTVFENQ